MTEGTIRRVLVVPAIIESLCWLLPPMAFLSLYVGSFRNPPQAILPHVMLVAALWMGTVGARTLLRLPRSGTPAYLATTLVLLPWLLLMIWYAAALLGLYSWGRLTTWPIFATYAAQAPHLLASLGYPTWLPWALPLVLGLLTAACGHFDLLRARWPRQMLDTTERRQRCALGALLTSLPLVLAAMIGLTVGTSPFEPVQISLLKSGNALKQHHEFSASPATNEAEREALDNYVVAPDARRRNVIMIVGDALRAGHMGVYGYPRDTTPYLSSLASQPGTSVVPRMRATCAESLCGLMSLAASRPLHEMPDEPFTLQQVLKRHGYQVHMILSGDHTNFYGLRDFYGAVDSYTDGSDQQVRWGEENEYRYVNDDQLVLDRVSALPDADPRQPVMFQIALMSSHGLGLRLEDSSRFQPAYNYYSWFRWSAGPERIKEGDRTGAVNFYDNGVFQLDGYVRMILAELERKGYLHDALVVVTGDHGELLGEHGYFAHAVTVYEPVLSIPLVLARFGYDAAPIPERPLAAQIDIAPTILRELEIPAPTTWAGLALQQAPAYGGRQVYFQQTMEAGLYDVAADGRILKYWRDYEDDSEYLFDVIEDPGERNNLLGQASSTQLDRWRLAVVHGGLQRGKADLPNNRAIGIEAPVRQDFPASESAEMASP